MTPAWKGNAKRIESRGTLQSFRHSGNDSFARANCARFGTAERWLVSSPGDPRGSKTHCAQIMRIYARSVTIARRVFSHFWLTDTNEWKILTLRIPPSQFFNFSFERMKLIILTSRCHINNERSQCTISRRNWLASMDFASQGRVSLWKKTNRPLEIPLARSARRLEERERESWDAYMQSVDSSHATLRSPAYVCTRVYIWRLCKSVG